MTKLEYTFKTDTLFKILFVNNPDLLKHLVSTLLNIQLENIEEFTIINSEIPAEAFGDKFCRLDINMRVDGQLVDLEIQVSNESAYPERVLFYWAREYSSSISEGQNYSELPRTIVISIIDFNLFDCPEFHSEFQPLEVTRHTLLSDKMSLHFFELKKIPLEYNPDNHLLLWLSLFKAETLEELNQIQSLEVPIMNQAINAYQHVTVSPEFRELERLRSKARHDEAQALFNARREEQEKWEKVLKQEIANKDAETSRIVSEKDAETSRIVSEKDAEIARLRKQLGHS
jgi:predicted transposase/invertase (TIGR01784 family)